MDILINVSKQRLKLATNLKKYVSGSQEFVRFVFGLNSYWRDLLTFAQFAQNGNTYNRYLDDENAVYLPAEIEAGECTLTLFGSGNSVIATTNYLTLTIDENILVSDATSTEISESLYEQLVDMVRSVSNGTAVVDAKNKMIDKNKIYVYIGSETGMTNGDWYYWNGTVWTSGGVWNAVAVETDKTLSVENKAADGKAAGSLVEVGSTQPTSTANKIWIDPTDEEVEIPEMSDLNAVDAKVDNLKSDLNDYVLSKYRTVEPTNWFNPSAITYGELKANGTVSESTTKFYTDFIPVVEGDKVSGFRTRPILPIYKRNVCAYDANKNVLSAKGTDSATTSAFTIQSDVAYVRITFDTNILTLSPIVVRDGVTPTAYTAYFEPYEELIEDFLTGESETALQKVSSNSLRTVDLKNNYGCALPEGYIFRQTVGIPETWYKINMATPPTDFISVGVGAEYYTKTNDAFTFPNTTAINSTNGFTWNWYDSLLVPVKSYAASSGYGAGRHIIEENLSDCTALVIGDSTVDFDTMTRNMLDYFTSKGKTLTLLGTIGDGTSDNRNEGRAGWKASDYLTDKSYNGVVNPFYNQTTDGFDFSFYMANQGYSAVDFVIIQLGINDLYNSSASAIVPTWNCIKAMIDSIFDYNSGIKVLLNLPTPPNTDESTHSGISGLLYRNRVIRYNEYAMSQALELYGVSKVRPSYCHLILNPDTDIRDNVHPTNNGFLKMAMEIINQINVWQNEI